MCRRGFSGYTYIFRTMQHAVIINIKINALGVVCEVPAGLVWMLDIVSWPLPFRSLALHEGVWNHGVDKNRHSTHTHTHVEINFGLFAANSLCTVWISWIEYSQMQFNFVCVLSYVNPPMAFILCPEKFSVIAMNEKQALANHKIIIIII